MLILILLRIFIVLYFVFLYKLIVLFSSLKTAIMTVNGELQQINDRSENLLKPEILKPENVMDFLAQTGAYTKEFEPLHDHIKNLNTIIYNDCSQLVLLVALLSFFVFLLYALALPFED